LKRVKKLLRLKGGAGPKAKKTKYKGDSPVVVWRRKSIPEEEETPARTREAVVHFQNTHRALQPPRRAIIGKGKKTDGFTKIIKGRAEKKQKTKGAVRKKKVTREAEHVGNVLRVEGVAGETELKKARKKGKIKGWESLLEQGGKGR